MYVSLSFTSSLSTTMSPSILTRLTQICRSLFFLCSSRRRKPSSSPELPTVAPTPHYETDSLRSWQIDKQQFLRRPSLRRASTHEMQKPRHREPVPPRGPEIYVEDWSSLGLNMSNFFETSSSRSVAAVSPGLSTNNSSTLATIPEADPGYLAPDNISPSRGSPTPPPKMPSEHLADDNSPPNPGSSMSQSITPSQPPADSSSSLGSSASQSSRVQKGLPIRSSNASHSKTRTKIESVTSRNAGAQKAALVSPFSSPYASNALSAVSGLLWDPASFTTSHSTPLPGAAPGFLAKPPLQSTVALGLDSTAPYPDLFDFSMYMRRISRDSFCETIELSSRDFGSVDQGCDKDKSRPVSIYDVHAVNERDRYRSAAYSACISTSPDRSPTQTSAPRQSGLWEECS
ncbi:hypothetical protein MSAN_01471200 [Mycena sanguinolenta]|uniref:Uncharacterized protein n=1 Tax=Mycena sanguinolenta TaxID=230812 RepID=A0A8H7D1D4_9AGAR|nr:hypothetical protein MSAN_01471200 [Mycena sanguinolenta]